jgi:membrane associated rhomboid family serine protease
VLYGVGSLGLEQAGGVAFFAHIGGFATGWLLIRILTAGRPGRQAADDLSFQTVDDVFRQRRGRDRWWE